MIPKLLCSSCGHELSPQDKFCSNCGAAVSVEEGSHESRASTTVHCRLCGSENPSDSRYCSACGAVLQTATGEGRTAHRGAQKSDEPKHRARSDHKPQEHKHQPKGGLPQGRIIAIFGGLLVVGIIVIGITRNQTKTTQSGAGSQSAISPTLIQDIEQLRNKVQVDSTDSEAILRLANLLHDGKFTDQAIIYYKKYLALNKKDADARVDLGICYFESGDRDRAIAEMKEALTYAPNHQLAHFNLGIVNLASGNLEAATEWFKKCIAINPQTETARRAEELIKQHTGASTPKLN
jgi:tetratricopeptide (TPR) repeat protein/predicted nucleic acid-binding Zn ribbon protein